MSPGFNLFLSPYLKEDVDLLQDFFFFYLGIQAYWLDRNNDMISIWIRIWASDPKTWQDRNSGCSNAASKIGDAGVQVMYSHLHDLSMTWSLCDRKSGSQTWSKFLILLLSIPILIVRYFPVMWHAFSCYVFSNLLFSVTYFLIIFHFL